MARRVGGAAQSGKVIELPVLPASPEPPRFPPDPRQIVSESIIGRLAGALEGPARKKRLALRTTNLRAGYPAAAVNVGELKEVIQGAVALFTPEQIRERWRKDVQAWIHAVVHRWVQRCKLSTVRLRKTHISVRIETRDDRGDYFYEFSIFLARPRR